MDAVPQVNTFPHPWLYPVIAEREVLFGLALQDDEYQMLVPIYKPPNHSGRPNRFLAGHPDRGFTEELTTFGYRKVNRSNPEGPEMLISTIAAYFTVHSTGPRIVTWAFSLNDKPNTEDPHSCVSGQLEVRTPVGELMFDKYKAKFARAAIAALEYRDWSQEGFTSVVISTPSRDLVDLLTRKPPKWRDLHHRARVQSGDLGDLLTRQPPDWQALHDLSRLKPLRSEEYLLHLFISIIMMKRQGCTVKICCSKHYPRKDRALEVASHAAGMPRQEKFIKTVGVLVP